MQRPITASDLLGKDGDVAIRRRKDDAVSLEVPQIATRGESGRDARRRDCGVVDPKGVTQASDARILHTERFERVLSREHRCRFDLEMQAVFGARTPEMRDGGQERISADHHQAAIVQLEARSITVPSAQLEAVGIRIVNR
jgi:hypothetical protein